MICSITYDSHDIPTLGWPSQIPKDALRKEAFYHLTKIAFFVQIQKFIFNLHEKNTKKRKSPLPQTISLYKVSDIDIYLGR